MLLCAVFASGCASTAEHFDKSRTASAPTVSAWAAAPQIPYYVNQDNPTRRTFENQTLREIVHLNAGGNEVRVHFTNLFGTAPLEIISAHVALRSLGSSIDAASDRQLTFGSDSSQSVIIPPGKTFLSNPVRLHVQVGNDISISIYLPRLGAGTTEHRQGLKTYLSRQGDFTSSVQIPLAETLKAWFFIDRVDVNCSRNAKAIVAFGDSLTDFFDQLEPEKKDSRWPDILGQSLRSSGDTVSVINLGISGSRLLYDAPEATIFTRDQGLNRFSRDVLSQPGVSAVIVLLGTNDLGRPGKYAPASEEVSAQEFIAGIERITEMAHAAGIQAIIGTIPPFAASTLGFSTPFREQARQQINTWIRNSHRVDGLADFDQVLRDPGHPERLLALYDSGDHTHPNDQGQRAMSRAVHGFTFGLSKCPSEIATKTAK